MSDPPARAPTGRAEVSTTREFSSAADEYEHCHLASARLLPPSNLDSARSKPEEALWPAAVETAPIAQTPKCARTPRRLSLRAGIAGVRRAADGISRRAARIAQRSGLRGGSDHWSQRVGSPRTSGSPSAAFPRRRRCMRQVDRRLLLDGIAAGRHVPLRHTQTTTGVTLASVHLGRRIACQLESTGRCAFPTLLAWTSRRMSSEDYQR